jgi:eukaryotic-like serine/threonine-protein kinase
MSASPGYNRKELYEFGPFRIDPEKQVVLRDREPVPLTPKTFQILLVLIRHNRKIVSKDELMKAVWPDTFVEESNLTRSVFMLRKALGETAQDHRYIVTVPGQGYRFTEDVRLVPEQELSIIAARHSRVRIDVEESRSWLRSIGARTHRRTMATAIAIALAAGALVVVLLGKHTSTLRSSDLVLTSDFVNTTGEPIFDGTLKQAVSVKLAESPYFALVPDDRTRHILKLMNRSPEERILPPISRELCQRVGAKAVVGGWIVRAGNEYGLNLIATNCATGAEIAKAEMVAADKDHVLSQLGNALSRLRRKLGESITSIQKFDTPTDQATTSSLAALKAFTSGEEKRTQGKEGESLPDYKLAVDLDPNFAMAYARLSAVTRSLNQNDLADEYLRMAYERREHLTEKENLYIQARYYSDTTREPENEIETYKLWSAMYPRDFYAFSGLTSAYIEIGELQKAIDAGQQSLRLNADHALPYANLARAYERASRFPEAKAICQKAIGEKVDSFWVHSVLFRIAFAENDDTAMQRELELFKGRPQESAITYYQAKATLSSGRVRQSRELFQRARLLAEARGLKEQEVAIINGEAQFEADMGNSREARALAERSFRMTSSSVRHRAFAALALARSGDSHTADLVVTKLSQERLLGTAIKDVVIPSIRAAIYSDHKQPRKALETLQTCTKYDLGTDSAGMTAYYRGLAHLQLGSGQEAAAEFEKITNNRGVVIADIYWPLAHLGLARAYAIAGNVDGSLAEYREVLAFWKDADPNFATFQHVRSEYAKLGNRQFQRASPGN